MVNGVDGRGVSRTMTLSSQSLVSASARSRRALADLVGARRDRRPHRRVAACPDVGASRVGRVL